MRTKTLLLAAAAVAAGALTTMAQSNVYSLNVVGYVNSDLPAQQAFIANPLDNGTNDLNSVLPNVPSKSTASFWNGLGFTNSIKGAAGWSPNISIPPGLGFFVNSKSANTATFVGQVACPVGGSVTNALGTGQTAVGSIIPYGGDLNTTNFGLAVIPSKSTANFWTGTNFQTSIKGAAGWSPAYSLVPGQGFFINSKAAVDWVETLPAQ